MANSCSHLRALLKKNWILFKRSPCSSCCEIFIPIIFILFLLAVRGLVDKKTVSEQSYLMDASTFYPRPIIDPELQNTINSMPYGSFQQINSLGALYNSNHLKNCLNTDRGGEIALSPQNAMTQAIEEKLKEFPGPVPIRYFDSLNQMDNYIQGPNYGSGDSPFLCLGIAVTKNSGGNYVYYLRYNTTGGNPELQDTETSINPITTPLIKVNFENSDKFINSGFLTLQNWLDNYILQVETNDQNATITPSLVSVRTPAYVSDNIALYLQGSTNVFFVLPLILPYLRMIARLLYEKEKKIREGMKMMGMTNTSFYLSWIITYILIYTVICVINASILTSNFFSYSNWFFIFFFLWFFCVVLIFQSLFVSVFFTRVKSGIIGGIVFFFILYIINTIVQSNSSSVSFETKRQTSLSSHAAMAFASESLLVMETNQIGLTSNTMRTMVNNYNFETYFGFEFINIIFFSLLSLYLDQVFPNEFGQKKHPLFFISWIWKKRRVHNVAKNYSMQDIEMQNINPAATTNDKIESVDYTLKQQELNNQAIMIKELNKVYPNGKQAVKNLSLNMYRDQIFVLLGHNGAGKTTTISILTGLLSPTSGTATIFGLDIQEEMDILRRSMGVCPQHDILFDTLTVREHLYLFATFKGVTAENARTEVEKMIDAVDLRAKADDFSKNLSGGQKRRLSVAIAFIGNSKLILLDEPTSGMDTSARRYIWEMLKNYKNDRIVILTTHFMDEADYLGDRIGIMGEGSLRCCGSSVFLKNRFGVGYNLIIVKKDTVKNPEIESFVQSYVPGAKCISNVAAEVAFQLPLTEVPKFKDLFMGIDDKKSELKIASYGISITTLEEVFLKVAEGEGETKNLDKRNNNGENNAENLAVQQKDDGIVEIENKVDDFDLNSVKIKQKVFLFFVHFWALLIKRWNYFKRDKKGLCCEVLLPCAIIGVGLCITLIQFIYTSPLLIMDPSVLNPPVYTPVQNIDFFNTKNFNEEYFNFLKFQGDDFNLVDFDKFVFDQRNISPDGLYGAFFLQNTQNNNYTYTALYNSTTAYSLPILMNQMNQAIIRSATNRQISVKCYLSPWPLTQTMKELQNTASGFIASFIFSISFAFIPASIIVFIVRERQLSIKYQQLVSGVSLLAYWLANFIVDLIKLVIPVIFSVLICLAFGIDGLTKPEESYGASWMLFIFYGPALVAFTYLVAFLFKDWGTAQAFIFVFTFLMSAVGSLIIFILRLVPSSRSGAKVAQYFIRIFPPFCFGYGILNISNRNLFAILEGYIQPKGALDKDVAAWDVIYLAIESVAYMILVFVVEKLLTIPSILRAFTKETSIPYEPIEYDSDVAEEMKRIEQSDPKEYTVYVKDLRKVYVMSKTRKKVAVTKSSFGIKNGDCFGLLGVNGAGKTTTFKMLCGEIAPTSGEVFIAGYDMVSQLDEARENIGYCPQFDALLDNLTAKEHLFLYAAIKGIPYNLRAELVEQKLVEMGLKRYENVCAGTYSGGNKRKLSVAIAMLGNPPIVFLDEPSTGMDPEARRFMWNVINRISNLRKQSSIILTTHSMEEAEALSTKISIMVNGTLKCLGSVQHIKNKFGKGYEIEIKTSIPNASEIEQLLHKAEIQKGKKITFYDLQHILEKINKVPYFENFAPKKSASHLLLELQKSNGLSVEALMDYVVVEDYGTKIMDFLEKEFENYTLLEHFQSFFRFKINSNVSVGKLFGCFEDSKNDLNISQYSIKQATIEQIFNMFAAEQDNELEGEPKNDQNNRELEHKPSSRILE